MIRRTLMATALSSLLVLAFAAPTFAANNQNQAGLVNVAIGDVELALPIALAANICDTNVNVLAVQLREGGAECDADAESGATFGPGGSGGNNQNQVGLVNVAAGDITILAPIALAANLCDTNINVLALQLREGGAECDAVSNAEAGA